MAFFQNLFRYCLASNPSQYTGGVGSRLKPTTEHNQLVSFCFSIIYNFLSIENQEALRSFYT